MISQYEQCTSYFFSSFLARNDFTARPSNEQQVLKASIHKSAGVRNAVIAIGALELIRYSKKRFLPTAVTYYKQAVSSLRVQLTMPTDIDDATLWTSVLLALFELMSNNTGTSFMLHFTKGVPTLLQKRRLSGGQIGCCRSLLHTVQLLEVIRVASFWTYTQPTLLEDPYWQQIMQEIDAESLEAHGFTTLYVLMGHFLTLNNILSPIVLEVPPDETNPRQQQQLLYAATEGWKLHHELEMWYFIQVGSGFENHMPTSLLCNIYHCTLTITLVSIFNFPHFSYCDIHILSSSTAKMNSQVDDLCVLLRTALRRTNLAGILLFWPLRVAGAKSVRPDQALQVLGMLREIQERGFAVAQSFEDVLVEKWRQKSLL